MAETQFFVGKSGPLRNIDVCRKMIGLMRMLSFTCKSENGLILYDNSAIEAHSLIRDSNSKMSGKNLPECRVTVN